MAEGLGRVGGAFFFFFFKFFWPGSSVFVLSLLAQLASSPSEIQIVFIVPHLGEEALQNNTHIMLLLWLKGCGTK